jgi:hypothetical protein
MDSEKSLDININYVQPSSNNGVQEESKNG